MPFVNVLPSHFRPSSVIIKEKSLIFRHFSVDILNFCQKNAGVKTKNGKEDTTQGKRLAVVEKGKKKEFIKEKSAIL